MPHLKGYQVSEGFLVLEGVAVKVGYEAEKGKTYKEKQHGL